MLRQWKCAKHSAKWLNQLLQVRLCLVLVLNCKYCTILHCAHKLHVFSPAAGKFSQVVPLDIHLMSLDTKKACKKCWESCRILKLCLLSFGSALTFLDDFWLLPVMFDPVDARHPAPPNMYETHWNPANNEMIFTIYIYLPYQLVIFPGFLSPDQARCDSLHQLMLEGLGQLLTESEVGNEKLVTLGFLSLRHLAVMNKKCIKVRDFGISAFWDTLRGYNIWYSLPCLVRRIMKAPKL